MKRLTFLLMAAVFLLYSCGGNKTHGTAEPEVQPVMTLIDGVLKRDATLWRSAFLPEYDAAMEAQELELGSCDVYECVGQAHQNGGQTRYVRGIQGHFYAEIPY